MQSCNKNFAIFSKIPTFVLKIDENGGKMKQFALVLALLSVVFALKVNAQTERVMLAEEFTNVGCVPCAMQNPAFDALLDANADRVVAVKYHPNWPSATDPMYPFDAEGNDARTTYYNVTTVPSSIIDGNRYYSVPSGVTQDIIDQLLGIPPRFEMQLSVVADTLVPKLKVIVDGQALTSMIGDVRLLVALVENEVHYEIPPGSNGEKDFYHVLHQFLTEPTGLGLGSMDSVQQFAYEFDCDLPQNQSFNNLSVVAWVQNYNTKEVYQACKSNVVATAVEETVQEDMLVYPNPTESIVNIVGGDQKVAIYNMVGQCVFESEGETMLCLDMKLYGSGVYVVKIGNKTRKIIVK